MIEDKLADIGVKLPSPPQPAGSYVPVVICGKLAFVSGQIPVVDGKVMHAGKVPTQKTIQQAQEAAKLCAINILAQLKSQLGDLEKISRFVRLGGFVNSTPEFTEHPQVINAASDLIFSVFGPRGRHTRVAVGVPSLPFDCTVEIDCIVELL